MRHFLSAGLFLASTLGAVAQDAKPTPMDGLWSARMVLGQNAMQIETNLTTVAGVGELGFTVILSGNLMNGLQNGSVALPDGFAYSAANNGMQCKYYFRCEGGTPSFVWLDQSTPGALSSECPRDPAFSLTRTALGPSS